MTVDMPAGCAGTAIEHRSGGWECTFARCTVELELHTLTIRCDEVLCRCTATTPGAEA